MKIKDFLIRLNEYYPGQYNKTQQEEVIRYLEIVEPCLLDALWTALTKVPLYKAERPMIEHLEIARAAALVAYDRYADFRRAERATALLPDEPYLSRDEALKKLHDIRMGLSAARHFGPKGGNLD
jgi:hypothetical protein